MLNACCNGISRRVLLPASSSVSRLSVLRSPLEMWGDAFHIISHFFASPLPSLDSFALSPSLCSPVLISLSASSPATPAVPGSPGVEDSHPVLRANSGNAEAVLGGGVVPTDSNTVRPEATPGRGGAGRAGGLQGLLAQARGRTRHLWGGRCLPCSVPDPNTGTEPPKRSQITN